MAKIRKHFYFSGRVQGVGFRYQACRIARGLGLTGYVQNLWDGRVELEAQGEEPVIWDLVSALHRQPYIQIEDMETADMALKEERGFQMAN
ncbi:acylphosphatase [Clostridiaceae bacterium]|nr:acylphosphatase [Clostridiaceae bacterium]RKI11091.1 acylphosphatase [bacterium 1XD21-70]